MRRSLTLFLAVVMLAVTPWTAGHTMRVGAQDATPCAQTSPEANKALIEQWTFEVFRDGNEAFGRDTMAEDYRHVWGVGNETVGVEPFFERLQLFHTAFPDLEITIDHMLAEDDLVAIGWTTTGTHDGDWLGIAPTGIEATWSGKNLFQIACGTIVMSSSTSDHLGLILQLSEMPAVATPAP